MARRILIIDDEQGIRAALGQLLEYEGYEDMAVKTMWQLAGVVHERWPAIDRVGITHRLGRIEIGESSVVIVVTSPHRKVAFEACHYAIDRLKQIVPIWKKEYFEDGAVWADGEPFPPEIATSHTERSLSD